MLKNELKQLYVQPVIQYWILLLLILLYIVTRNNYYSSTIQVILELILLFLWVVIPLLFAKTSHKIYIHIVVSIVFLRIRTRYGNIFDTNSDEVLLFYVFLLPLILLLYIFFNNWFINFLKNSYLKYKTRILIISSVLIILFIGLVATNIMGNLKNDDLMNKLEIVVGRYGNDIISIEEMEGYCNELSADKYKRDQARCYECLKLRQSGLYDETKTCLYQITI